MKCTEARNLVGPYLDSELDVRCTEEVRVHLADCSACAAFYRAEQGFNNALDEKLRKPARTASWWEAQEAFVTRAFHQRSAAATAPSRTSDARTALQYFWQELLWPSPRYYMGLAVVWLLLTVVRPTVPEAAPEAGLKARRMSLESKLTLLAQRRHLRELLGASESSGERVVEKTVSPRSQRGGNEPSAGRDHPGSLSSTPEPPLVLAQIHWNPQLSPTSL